MVGYYLHTIHSEYLFIPFAFFTIIEFSSFCLFYYFIWNKKRKTNFIFPVWLCFIAFALIDFFFINKMNDFDSVTIGVESIVIILMCIYYLITQIRGSVDLLVYSTSNFWVVITFLIYLSGTFFLYIMTETMIYNDAFRIQYVFINSGFNILKNILLSIAMVMKSDNNKSDKIKLYHGINKSLAN